MATKTLTLSADQMVSYRKIDANGTVSYEKVAGRGRAGGADNGINAAYEWRVLCDFSGLWTADIDAGSIDSIRLILSGSGASANIDVAEIEAYAWSGLSIGDSEAESGWISAKLGELAGEAVFYKSTESKAGMELGSAAVDALTQYRTIGIVPKYAPEAGNDDSYLVDFSAAALEITYTSTVTPPVIGGLSVASPSMGNAMASYTDPLTLSWAYSQDAGLAQSRIDVQMRTDQTDWMDVAYQYASSAQSYVISPASFPGPYAQGNLVYIRVRVYSSAMVTSEWASAAVVLIFPETYNLEPGGGSVVLSENATELRWMVRCVYGSTELSMANVPTVYDIQYSSNGGDAWSALASRYTAGMSEGYYTYTVRANTFPAGVIQWRVRPRVNGNAIETWAQESVVARIQASTSSVSCDGKPHPTVSWTASSQIAYQVRFADYDSGAVYSADQSHTIPYVYASGVYPVQVRTQAEDGTWSDWTELEYVTITNDAPDGIVELYADSLKRSVELRWMIDGPAETFIVYRNDIPIYVGLARSYTDAGAYGECRYYVRAVSGGHYIQSRTVTINARPVRDCMYDTVSGKWIDLKYSISPRSRGYNETVNAVYKYYAGRRYPVAYVDGTADRQLTASYCHKTLADADAVREALGHLVIYKDTRGRRIIGLFAALNETVEHRLVMHTINIVQADYNEEVRYET